MYRLPIKTEEKMTFKNTAGQKCLAVVDKNSERTGTKIFRKVKSLKDKRGLPFYIIRELTMEEVERNCSCYMRLYIDSEKIKHTGERVVRSHFEKVCKGNMSRYLEAKPEPDTIKYTVELSKQQKAGLKAKIQKEIEAVEFYETGKREIKTDEGEDSLHLEFEYSVKAKGGKVQETAVKPLKYYRGYYKVWEDVGGKTVSSDGMRRFTERTTHRKWIASEKSVTEADQRKLLAEAKEMAERIAKIRLDNKKIKSAVAYRHGLTDIRRIIENL